jgi:hypothetical protein
LEAFEKWGAVKPLELSALIEPTDWDAHWANHDAIVEKMRQAQLLAEQIKLALIKALNEVRQDASPRSSELTPVPTPSAL